MDNRAYGVLDLNIVGRDGLYNQTQAEGGAVWTGLNSEVVIGDDAFFQGNHAEYIPDVPPLEPYAFPSTGAIVNSQQQRLRSLGGLTSFSQFDHARLDGAFLKGKGMRWNTSHTNIMQALPENVTIFDLKLAASSRGHTLDHTQPISQSVEFAKLQRMHDEAANRTGTSVDKTRKDSNLESLSHPVPPWRPPECVCSEAPSLSLGSNTFDNNPVTGLTLDSPCFRVSTCFVANDI